MKKTFQLTHAKLKPARQLDAIKHELKKYLKRERKKKLPDDVDFWDFDCKFGPTTEDAQVVHADDLNKSIDRASEQGLASFYVEILCKPGRRKKRPKDNA